MCLVDNFNDVALRVTNLGQSTDSIKKGVNSTVDQIILVRDDVIAALSSVDKNIVNNVNENFTSMLQKIGNKLSQKDLDAFSNKLLGTIDQNVMHEKERSKLKHENQSIIESKLKIENQVNILKEKLETKFKEIETLNEKIANLTAENNELINSQLTVINDLQREKSELLDQLKEINGKHNQTIKEFERKIEIANTNSKSIEKQNIKLFNEEQKKYKALEERFAQQNSKYNSLQNDNIALQNKINNFKDDNKSFDKELNNVKRDHEIELKSLKNEIVQVEASRDKLLAELKLLKNSIEDGENHIKELTHTLKNKENNLLDFKEEFAKAQKTSEDVLKIKENKIDQLQKKIQKFEQLQDEAKLNSRSIFPESRTSTAIKEEKLESQTGHDISPIKLEPVKSKNEKMKAKPKNVTNRRNPDKKGELLIDKASIKPKIKLGKKTTSINAKIAKPKRKLISSSQVSSRSSQSTGKDKKGETITKNILQDLDIFNEFEAIDRIGTIGKPGW